MRASIHPSTSLNDLESCRTLRERCNIRHFVPACHSTSIADIRVICQASWEWTEYHMKGGCVYEQEYKTLLVALIRMHSFMFDPWSISWNPEKLLLFALCLSVPKTGGSSNFQLPAVDPCPGEAYIFSVVCGEYGRRYYGKTCCVKPGQ